VVLPQEGIAQKNQLPPAEKRSLAEWGKGGQPGVGSWKRRGTSKGQVSTKGGGRREGKRGRGNDRPAVSRQCCFTPQKFRKEIAGEKLQEGRDVSSRLHDPRRYSLRFSGWKEERKLSCPKRPDGGTMSRIFTL